MKLLSKNFRSLISSVIRTERLISTQACRLQKEATQSIDTYQDAALDKEICILVDENDKFVGTASKRECHKVGAKGDLLLHRAFSVFIFNKKGEMLIHRRSSHKVTFPNLYTNSCCSHPLFIDGKEEDVVTAAMRKLNQELGIPLEQMDPQAFSFVCRFLYKDPGDGVWGEHELDHVMIYQDDLTIKPNPNEIAECAYVSKKDFDSFVATSKYPLTPWFDLMRRKRLQLWWDNLHCLHKVADPHYIHTFTAGEN